MDARLAVALDEQRRREAAGKKQETGDRGQETGDRGQETGDRGHTARIGVAPVFDRRSEPESAGESADDAGRGPAPQVIEADGPSPVDEAAESAFLAEARDRGEVVTSKVASEAIEETNAKPLPSLDELVQRIPAEVRDTLEDLFRARFVTVKRVPKKALKQP